MKYNPTIVLAYFSEMSLPSPSLEYVFAPPRKFRFDFAWPKQKVALEVEGGVWSHGAHGRGWGIVRDIEKGNLAVLNGWRVLRVLPPYLCTTETVRALALLMENSKSRRGSRRASR